MYKIVTTHKFEKDVQKCIKRGWDMGLLRKAMKTLAEKGELPIEYGTHKLSGKYSGHWECHIKADWVMVWKKHNDIVTMVFTDTGSHSDVFGK